MTRNHLPTRFAPFNLRALSICSAINGPASIDKIVVVSTTDVKRTVLLCSCGLTSRRESRPDDRNLSKCPQRWTALANVESSHRTLSHTSENTGSALNPTDPAPLFLFFYNDLDGFVREKRRRVVGHARL